jgi:putative acetyltransferase
VKPIAIRRERPEDAARIRAVNVAAFGETTEADIVDRIRDRGGIQLSLVADVDSVLVGHILFTAVTVAGGGGMARGAGLAPMAVEPGYQGRGVGSALVGRGLEMLRSDGCPFVVVLGHPTYYPRFGFERASEHGIASEYDGVPDEAFMILELAPGALEGVSGVARYRREFAAAG